MGIDSILIVVWFTIKPYSWFILLLALLLTISLIRRRKETRELNTKAVLASAIVAVIAILIAPTFTGSSLSYVRTSFDIVALVGIGIGAFIYSWLVLRQWVH
ncbi:oxidoreductase [Vibrio sp. V11_P1A41T118]|nr:oxidoreductase [Vibrio sp. V11_P1A41T118]